MPFHATARENLQTWYVLPMRHIVVTGASSGIGEAVAREFAGVGDSVTLVARRRELLEKLASELKGKTRVVAADLADSAQATSWLPAAVAELGPVDILINNAGVQIVAPTVEVANDEARRLYEVDLLSPLALIRAVLPSMLARRSGAIVNIASLAALAPTPGMMDYNAAKGALAAASESLRGELRKSGVHVLTVYPGPVHTPMGDAGYAAYPPTLGVKLLPAGTTGVLAERIRRAVDRRQARIIYPRLYAITRYFPAVTRIALDLSTPPPYSVGAPERQRALEAKKS
jgi:short-subunit dehydrogenase